MRHKQKGRVKTHDVEFETKKWERQRKMKLTDIFLMILRFDTMIFVANKGGFFF
jgi:hypothetical protein